MRSSKKRSRSSQNRPRTLGNIVNRVFDSSGPEGKVRGTPQQIIEKYQALARDAQLSNDRVAAENFLQHAEHYTRMLAEAQREMAAEQEARQNQYQQGGGHNGGQNGGQNGNRDRNDYRDRNDRNDRTDRGDRSDYRAPAAEEPAASGVEVIDFGGDEAGLVDLPEVRPAPEETPARNERRDGGQHAPRTNDRGGSNERRDRPQGEKRDYRRDDRRRPTGEGPQPELPAFITSPMPVVTEAPAPVAPPAPEPMAAPAAEAPAAQPAAEAKPKRARSTRKPKAEAEPAAETVAPGASGE